MRYFLTFLLLIYLLFYSCAKKKEGVHPEYRFLTESVYASGNIVPEHDRIALQYKAAITKPSFRTTSAMPVTNTNSMR